MLTYSSRLTRLSRDVWNPNNQSTTNCVSAAICPTIYEIPGVCLGIRMVLGCLLCRRKCGRLLENTWASLLPQVKSCMSLSPIRVWFSICKFWYFCLDTKPKNYPQSCQSLPHFSRLVHASFARASDPAFARNSRRISTSTVCVHPKLILNNSQFVRHS
jgi:hypothetical protein